jgi:hypothetical protein
MVVYLEVLWRANIIRDSNPSRIAAGAWTIDFQGFSSKWLDHFTIWATSPATVPTSWTTSPYPNATDPAYSALLYIRILSLAKNKWENGSCKSWDTVFALVRSKGLGNHELYTQDQYMRSQYIMCVGEGKAASGLVKVFSKALTPSTDQWRLLDLVIL